MRLQDSHSCVNIATSWVAVFNEGIQDGGVHVKTSGECIKRKEDVLTIEQGMPREDI